ncbi:MAG: endonuclease V [Candidatus Helarchaeota archaeon]
MSIECFLELAARHSPDLGELRNYQRKIAKKIIQKDQFEIPIKYIGGVDGAYLNDTIVAVCVVLKWPTLELIEKKTVISNVSFPYISSFFAFREGPSILRVLSQLEITPTILLFDSHGIAHPAFAGLASHIGVLTDLPTIGVAKNILCGSWPSDPIAVGDWSPIYFQNKIIGAYYLSQKKNKPIIISIGHRITLKTAVELTKNCIRGHRMPEPILLAHQMANAEKRKLEAK